jgi:hypothetical protein
LHAAARDLVLAAHHGPPGSLFGVGHKTERQLLRDQALHETFRVGKVSVSPAGTPIRLRLCKVQRPRDTGSGERASSHQSGSQAIAGASTRRRSIIRSITHAPGQTVARPHWLHGQSRPRRSHRHSAQAKIFMAFRGPPGPAATSCGNRPLRRAISRGRPDSSSGMFHLRRLRGIPEPCVVGTLQHPC